jgi:hypothetical protein
MEENVTARQATYENMRRIDALFLPVKKDNNTDRLIIFNTYCFIIDYYRLIS